MMSQKSKHTPRKEETPSEPVEENAEGATERAKKVREEADDILDKIDEVLEKNASGFVKSFIQKGGE
jgi:ubiquitin-like protein Pup